MIAAGLMGIYGFAATVLAGEDSTVVVLVGELDLDTVPRFTAALEHAWRETDSEIIVDLSQLTFLDSGGISVLAGAHRRAEAECRPFSIRAPQGQPGRVLAITNVLRGLGAGSGR